MIDLLKPFHSEMLLTGYPTIAEFDAGARVVFVLRYEVVLWHSVPVPTEPLQLAVVLVVIHGEENKMAPVHIT